MKNLMYFPLRAGEYCQRVLWKTTEEDEPEGFSRWR